MKVQGTQEDEDELLQKRRKIREFFNGGLMSKIAVIGDMHFSIRGGSSVYIENMNRFLDDVLFPTIEKYDIKVVLQTGDLYDNKKTNSNLAVHNSKVKCFDRLAVMGVDFYTIVGNHCMHVKDKTYPNSSSLFLAEYSNVLVATEPQTVNVGGIDIDLIPWICETNKDNILNYIKKSKSTVCMAHPEINGFQMSKHKECLDGLDRNIFSNYKLVIAGHFHEKSKQGNIMYVGSPTQHDYGDVTSERGFYVFDTDTYDMEFIENPYTLYTRIEYSDVLDIKDTPDVENKYVSIIMPSKYDELRYQKFLDELLTFSPLAVIGTRARVKLIQLDDEDDDGEDTEQSTTLTDAEIESVENMSRDIVPFLAKYTHNLDTSELSEDGFSTRYEKYYNMVVDKE
jgi:DNA repair exonuclease SbcCD nuclease subunit